MTIREANENLLREKTITLDIPLFPSILTSKMSGTTKIIKNMRKQRNYTDNQLKQEIIEEMQGNSKQTFTIQADKIKKSNRPPLGRSA